MADFDPFADPADEAETAEATATGTQAGATGGDAEATGEVPGPWGRALETEEEVVIGKLAALHTFPPGQKAKCGVIICGGGVGVLFGSANMDIPLISAIAKACSDAGIPRLRFDYIGSGRSRELATEEEKKLADFGNELSSDVGGGGYFSDQINLVVAHMLENFCSKLVLVGYSMGAQEGMRAVRRNKRVRAICALDVGFEVWRRILFPDDESKDKGRIYCQRIHKECEHPILYVVGENDSMTPLDTLRSLVSCRNDGGAGVTIETVPDADHPFSGHEDEAAAKVIAWLGQEMGA